MRSRKSLIAGIVAFVLLVLTFAPLVLSADKLEKYIPDASGAEEGMTLWQIILSGGWIMVLLAALSVAALSLVIYYFMTLKPETLLPEDFMKDAFTLVEDKKYEDAKKLCRQNDNLVSEVLMAGLSREGMEKIVIKETMQEKGRRSVDGLWQKLSYLGDVAAISPMVGLLGTVLGMIQAFNVIAFQTGAVKPILLASGISKAMVTTAAGLIIAIPSMLFYTYFRGKVQDVSSRFENISTELFQMITEK